MTLFMANIWDELLSERGLRQLEQRYGPVRGNWLRGARKASAPGKQHIVVLAPATIEGAISPGEIEDNSRTLLPWALFPDQLVGWDFTTHRYRYQMHPVLADAIRISDRLLVNSRFTARTLEAAGVDRLPHVVPLAVDLTGISEAADPIRARSTTDTVHVHWGHMWRTQKDPETALDILRQVLDRVPQTKVTVGRSFSWCGEQHSPPRFRQRVLADLDSLTESHPGRLDLVSWFASPPDYWRFLGSVDISFSCSREESFGVALMEHAAAGVACVAPRAQCYPDVHAGALIMPPSAEDLADGVCTLATGTEQRKRVSMSCRRTARRYRPEVVIELLCGEIERAVRG